MAPHSSTLASKISWMEEPGGLQSLGSLRVRHDWTISLSLFTFMHWRRKWQPTPLFLPGESQGRRSLVGAIYGITQSWTRLKQLSSNSSRIIQHIVLLSGFLHSILCLWNLLLSHQGTWIWAKLHAVASNSSPFPHSWVEFCGGITSQFIHSTVEGHLGGS